MNGDGNPDVVVANGGSNSVSVLMGNGDGTFQPAVPYGSGGSGTDSVAIRDVNGDGNPDVVVANGGSNSVSMLMGNGDGTFQPAVPYGSGGSGAFSVAVADVNGDGKPDLLVANSCSAIGGNYIGSVGVLINIASPLNTTTTAIASSSNPSAFGTVRDIHGYGDFAGFWHAHWDGHLHLWQHDPVQRRDAQRRDGNLCVLGSASWVRYRHSHL